jgi:hypothetical protein
MSVHVAVSKSTMEDSRDAESNICISPCNDHYFDVSYTSRFERYVHVAVSKSENSHVRLSYCFEIHNEGLQYR